jgi:glycosyltransferase involved in cell wall biosynthesis
VAREPVVAAVYSAAAPTAPSYRVRAILLRRALAAHGVLLDPRPLLPGGEALGPLALLRARRRFLAGVRAAALPVGCAVVQRQVDYLPTLTLERTVARGRRLVYDVDDAIWTRDPSSGAHALAAVKRAGAKARWLASHADHVVAGNRILAEWLSAHARAVTVVPSLVDPRRIAVRRHEEHAGVVLGWIGSRTTARYLDTLDVALREAARRVPGGVTLLVVGGEPAARVPGVAYEVIPWSEDAERDALARMDVGIMPLADTPWTRGKCAYKALQYMAAGVPVVADPVGITPEAVGDGGITARGAEAWADAIVRLAADPEERARLGTAGRVRVEREFSVERWAPVLAAVLRGDGG